MDSEQDAYDELCGYTLGHRDPSFIHQHVVDAFAVQRADRETKAIKLTFGLVGLFLKVERQYSGRQVQRVHMQLARHKQAWPAFVLPADRGSVLVRDVMAAPPGPKRDEMIDVWCASVWDAWRGSYGTVLALLKEHGIMS